MTYEYFKISQAHIEFLRENRIFVHAGGAFGVGWFTEGTWYRAPFDLAAEPYSDHRRGPTLSALGAFTYTGSCLGKDAQVGRYCAIGQNVTVMGANHPISRVSMSGFDYDDPAPYGPYTRDRGVEFPLTRLPPETFRGGVTIGNDVWIGAGALIARNVTIGTGAIVAANAVVTRDVEPYTLVAGSPARVKKRRFSEDLSARLLASEWWHYPFDAFRDMATTEPERFLDQLAEATEAGQIEKMPENRISLHAAFAEITEVVKAEEARAAERAARAAEKTRREAEEKALATKAAAEEKARLAQERALKAKAAAQEKARKQAAKDARIAAEIKRLRAFEDAYNRQFHVRARRKVGRILRRLRG